MSITPTPLKWTLLLGGLAYLLFTQETTGQMVVSTGNDSSSSATVVMSTQGALLESYLREQSTLMGDRESLIAQGAPAIQLEVWYEQNLSLFRAQRQQAWQLSAYSTAQPLESITDLVVPEGIPQTLEDLMVTSATLSNAFAQIHNQFLQGMGSTSCQALTRAGQKAENLFQLQNAEALKMQMVRAKALSAQSTPQLLEVPPPLTLPAGFSSQLQALLVFKDQIMRAEIQLHNQYASCTPEQRQAAIDQWEQQNSAQFAQLHQLAKNLAQSTQNQERNEYQNP